MPVYLDEARWAHAHGHGLAYLTWLRLSCLDEAKSGWIVDAKLKLEASLGGDASYALKKFHHSPYALPAKYWGLCALYMDSMRRTWRAGRAPSTAGWVSGVPPRLHSPQLALHAAPERQESGGGRYSLSPVNRMAQAPVRAWTVACRTAQKNAITKLNAGVIR